MDAAQFDRRPVFCERAGLESWGVAGPPAEMGAGDKVQRRARGGRVLFPAQGIR